MSDLQIITDALVKFRDEREWAQFHDSKNLALAISIEAAELNELFLWKDGAAAEGVDKGRKGQGHREKIQRTLSLIICILSMIVYQKSKEEFSVYPSVYVGRLPYL